MKRRDFIKSTAAGAAAAALGMRCAETHPVPSYLADFADLYRQDMHVAAREWFSHAKFGLFMHYGLYSILARGEWVMLREQIPVSEYEKLFDQFNPAKFDADFITDLALDAGMSYVNITSKHHDGFALFHSNQYDYHSVAARERDLIGELAEQCRAKGLGLFLYYSIAADWHHPYFYSREAGWNNARPAYDEKPDPYKFQTDADFAKYLEFARAQLNEVLTQYGPLAGIWFDPIMGFYHRPDLFPMQDIYDDIRQAQPQALISFKQGATGTEDFAAPERHGRGFGDRFPDRPDLAKIAAHAWEQNKNKHNEICDTMQPRVWGYKADDAGSHDTPDDVMRKLENAAAANCNLLLNTGPLPDGSINPEDQATLREVGKRLRRRDV